MSPQHHDILANRECQQLFPDLFQIFLRLFSDSYYVLGGKKMIRTKQTNPAELPPLKRFAYLGLDYADKLKYLAETLAEKENWYYEAPNMDASRRKYGVLFQYIHHTFARAEYENKIYQNEAYALMNTGLLTSNGEEIFMFFTKNLIPGRQAWYFKTFLRESSHDIPEAMRGSLPATVDYFAGQPEKMYFNTSLRILTNMDHIIDEHFDRLPERIRTYEKDVLKLLFNSAGEIMRKRIARNNRIVVPQYYNQKIMYLAPLKITDTLIPLAIEPFEQSYRINTIFTPSMAYCNARLLMRPESNWLSND